MTTLPKGDDEERDSALIDNFSGIAVDVLKDMEELFANNVCFATLRTQDKSEAGWRELVPSQGLQYVWLAYLDVQPKVRLSTAFRIGFSQSTGSLRTVVVAARIDADGKPHVDNRVDLRDEAVSKDMVFRLIEPSFSALKNEIGKIISPPAK